MGHNNHCVTDRQLCYAFLSHVVKWISFSRGECPCCTVRFRLSRRLLSNSSLHARLSLLRTHVDIVSTNGLSAAQFLASLHRFSVSVWRLREKRLRSRDICYVRFVSLSKQYKQCFVHNFFKGCDEQPLLGSAIVRKETNDIWRHAITGFLLSRLWSVVHNLFLGSVGLASTTDMGLNINPSYTVDAVILLLLGIAWVVLSAVILLNMLIALISNAYQRVEVKKNMTCST